MVKYPSSKQIKTNHALPLHSPLPQQDTKGIKTNQTMKKQETTDYNLTGNRKGAIACQEFYDHLSGRLPNTKPHSLPNPEGI